LVVRASEEVRWQPTICKYTLRSEKMDAGLGVNASPPGPSTILRFLTAGWCYGKPFIICFSQSQISWFFE
jgi:hypothetical protein